MTAILTLSPLLKGSGNYTSICRLRGYFDNNGWQTYLASPDEFLDGDLDLETYISDNNVGLVLGIHAYKAGRLLSGLSVPYILVLGGTDINVDSGDVDKMRVMTEAVHGARHIIAFGEGMMQTFFKLWPNYNRQKTSIIPSAVTVEPSAFNIKEYIRNNNRLEPNESFLQSHDQSESHDLQMESHDQSVDDEDMKIFIFAGGIRPVKNPLFVVKEFSDWRENNKRKDCFMLFVGPEMDKIYFEEFTRTINRLPGVVYIQRLETQDTHAAIRDSFALVNSSESEGMSQAILEAMSLDTLAVVRDIPGNTALVTDNSNGLVFKTSKEFLEKIELLLGDESLVAKITQNARDYVSQHHSVAAEEKAYITVVKDVLRLQ